MAVSTCIHVRGLQRSALNKDVITQLANACLIESAHETGNARVASSSTPEKVLRKIVWLMRAELSHLQAHPLKGGIFL
ncbi:hypothetical protein IQ22_03030 [Pseudomonas duriflava]|uniref:Uncharacterized protein n=1 Tax=Pseudomonas duriflava TaxID=459528 RepID=A0A562Q8X5_9PSED|nr:hypothetical protein IQ22_03030 [Pseudomonas duriflava]